MYIASNSELNPDISASKCMAIVAITMAKNLKYNMLFGNILV